jgi:hypothetical protein
VEWVRQRLRTLFGREERVDDAELDEIDQTLDKIEPLVRDIIKRYPLGRLRADLDHLNGLVTDFGGISTEASKLLSVLIKEAELVADKSGKEKKEFCIKAFMEMYRRHHVDLPHIPEFMEKPLLEFILSIAIDYTIDLFNLNFGDAWIDVTKTTEPVLSPPLSQPSQPPALTS